ncbi:hypothetical protein [Treponema sp. R8-4-B8]
MAKTLGEPAYEPFQRLNSVGRKLYRGFVAELLFSEFSLFYSKVSPAGNPQKMFLPQSACPACTQGFIGHTSSSGNKAFTTKLALTHHKKLL